MKIALIFFCLSATFAHAEGSPGPTPSGPVDTRGMDVAPRPGVHFEEKLREHSFGESATYVGSLYVVNVLGYLATQHEAIRTEGSWANYRYHLFKVVRTDYDTWNFNWGTHVITGAATDLFYRSRSYSRIDSLLMTALQSALFEFTIEVYTEPASLEDLINTPLLGAVAGTFLEWASFSLLNTDSAFLHGIGHVLNPFTLFGLHEGEVEFKPEFSHDIKGAGFQWHF